MSKKVNKQSMNDKDCKYLPNESMLNMRIENGVLKQDYDNDYMRARIDNEIQKRKSICLTKPNICIVTSCGLLSNVSFNEKDLIKRLHPPTNNILSISCDHGILYNVAYTPPIKAAKSNKGRKPIPKKFHKKRKVNGKQSDFFGSQITFEVASNDSWRISLSMCYPLKIKVFRNGKIQIPGGYNSELVDVIEPVNNVCKYLSNELKSDVKISYLTPEMINYNCALLNPKLLICLRRVKDYINNYKNDKPSFLKDEKIDNQLTIMQESYGWGNKFKRMIESCSEANIAEVLSINSSVFIKFNNPRTLNDEDKKITVLLSKSGKININGSNNLFSIYYIYYILNNFFHNSEGLFTFDGTKLDSYYDESEEESKESIYDSD